MNDREKHQKCAPIFDVLSKRLDRRIVSFHTPGHKNGQSIDPDLVSLTGGKVYGFDVTVFSEVDSLHDPVSSIQEAQKLVAQSFGVRESFFLVNGSTLGNQAMLLSACNPGDSVIVSREIHKSILSGIILAGLWPIWIQPRFDNELGVLLGCSADQIEDALKKFPEAKAVFLTHPSYNGISLDLKSIAKIVHKYGKILLIDEAHGAHLKFHSELPISSVDIGVDLCVQSFHKTLSTLSQGSILHCCSDKVDISRIKKVISLLQTTSPNYLILCSLDLARRQAFLHGHSIIENLLKYVEEFNESTKQFNHISSLKRKTVQSKGYDLDRLKLTINVSKTGFSGYEIDEILSTKYNIQVDMSDAFNLVAVLGFGTRKQDIDTFIVALKDIDKHYIRRQSNAFLSSMPPLSTEMVMMPREVFLNEDTEVVHIQEALGRISAQTLTPYPPGIPVLIPGERVTQDICYYLVNIANNRFLRVSGQETKSLNYLKVVKV